MKVLYATGQPVWSSDSRWLAYTITQENGNNAIFLYNTEDKESTQATSGFYSDINPTFDPEGKLSVPGDQSLVHPGVQ